MSNNAKLVNVDLGILVLRISVGALMLFHGIAKIINGHGAVKGILTQKGWLDFLWLGVPLTEIIAPILIILGVLTRVSGLGIVLVMICTLFLAFGWSAFAIGEYGGLVAELNLLYLGGGLALLFTGGGKYSVYKFKNELLN
ncbi:DoxX family protein [Pedobacter rhizosphaerae]|uniref:Putative oxidoreductase n=1 Tax=Pedobacter rhizosphaerae TaxID=390241 RepID=A0A1H9SVB3_9SPHI|nr:DoxX family protein [Pedobacter rhizosphaerae]SER88825.1 putative oxidoreductase [Pedobacter rhizosphaerae]